MHTHTQKLPAAALARVPTCGATETIYRAGLQAGSPVQPPASLAECTRDLSRIFSWSYSLTPTCREGSRVSGTTAVAPARSRLRPWLTSCARTYDLTLGKCLFSAQTVR